MFSIQGRTVLEDGFAIKNSGSIFCEESSVGKKWKRRSDDCSVMFGLRIQMGVDVCLIAMGKSSGIGKLCISIRYFFNLYLVVGAGKSGVFI